MADWAASAPAGPDAFVGLVGGSPLEKVLAQVRGPIAFDEVRRGAFPRHVQAGWAGNTTPFTIRGRSYDKVTVNQIWATIRTDSPHQYLSPNDVLEGRTLAVCCIFLMELLGRNQRALQLVADYVTHFYESSPGYLTLLELHAGEPVTTLWSSSPALVYKRLWEAALTGWYALHTLVSDAENNALQAMATVRCLLLAKLLDENDLYSVSTGGAFLTAADDAYSDVGAQPFRLILAAMTRRLELTLSLNTATRDGDLRTWYQNLLNAMRTDFIERESQGYELGTGTPPDGNPLNWMDDGGTRAMQLSVGSTRVAEWFRLRHLLVRTRLPVERKQNALREYFADMQ